MGQYYKVMNLDKKQFLHPHKLGDGLKLMEFGCSANGTMTALALLLADGNGRGGGDMRSDSRLIGSWAGDRIVIAGDYADEGKWGYPDVLYYHSNERDDGSPADFEDISLKIREVMCEDSYVAKSMSKSLSE
jgi:hypothetical protein